MTQLATWITHAFWIIDQIGKMQSALPLFFTEQVLISRRIFERECAAKIHSDNVLHKKEAASLVFRFHAVLKTILPMSLLTELPSLLSFLALTIFPCSFCPCNILFPGLRNIRKPMLHTSPQHQFILKCNSFGSLYWWWQRVDDIGYDSTFNISNRIFATEFQSS